MRSGGHGSTIAGRLSRCIFLVLRQSVGIESPGAEPLVLQHRLLDPEPELPLRAGADVSGALERAFHGL